MTKHNDGKRMLPAEIERAIAEEQLKGARLQALCILFGASVTALILWQLFG